MVFEKVSLRLPPSVALGEQVIGASPYQELQVDYRPDNLA
jgi:hypothetical protein